MHRNLECQVHESRQIESGQTGDGKSELDFLGISELKWTGMGEFSTDDHYIYNCKQESLRRNGIAIIVNKRVQNAVLGCNLKNNRMISVHFQANHSISQNNKIDYILCSQRWRSSILSAKTRPGADCGSDHELLLPNSDSNRRK